MSGQQLSELIARRSTGPIPAILYRVLAVTMMVSLLAGCTVRHTISVSGDALLASANTLRTTGKASVETHELVDSETDDPERRARLETVTIDQTVTDPRGRTRWVRDLLRGCEPSEAGRAPNVDCILAAGGYYDLRAWETRDIGPVLGGAIAAAVVGGLGTAGICLEKCDTGSTPYEVSKWSLIGTGTLVVGVIVWAIIDCSGKWGQPGCRD